MEKEEMLKERKIMKRGKNKKSTKKKKGKNT